MPKERQARWQKSQSRSGAISGRSHLATADKIFDRISGLEAPSGKITYTTDEIPHDVFFPLTEDEIAAALGEASASDASGITHVWLRRARASDFRSGRIPLAEYIAVDNIALLVFYPWPENLRMPLTKKPGDVIVNRYKRWSPKLTSHKGKWHFEWQTEQAKDFCLSELIRHEIQVHSDFIQKHAAREARKGESLPVQFASQRYFEESLVIY